MNGSRRTRPRSGKSPSPPNLQKEVIRTAELLRPVAGRTARYEAETVITFLTGLPRHRLYLGPASPLSPTLRTRLRRIISRRLSGEPLPYVLGTAYFHSVELRVGPDVLIPRPETEILVELVLHEERSENCVFLDMGTGSGAIAAALLAARPGWRAIATDISAAALRVARLNLPDSCLCVCADGLQSVRGPVDFVVSNPPYVSCRELRRLPRSVRNFEPMVALDGGTDGLSFYRYLAHAVKRCVRSGGSLYVEIGSTQGSAVATLLLQNGWSDVKVGQDLAGRDRTVSARWLV